MTGYGTKTAEDKLYGFVRRLSSDGCRIDGARGAPVLHAVPPGAGGAVVPGLAAASSPSAVEAIFRHDLVRLEQQKQEHLHTPHPYGRGIMTRTGNLGYILALMVMGLLFFCAGFLTCYWVYPPKGSGHRSMHVPTLALLGDAGQSGQVASTLRDDLGRSLNEAKKRSLNAIASEGTNLINQNISRYTEGINGALGPHLGRVLAPLTGGLVQSVARKETDRAMGALTNQRPTQSPANAGRFKNGRDAEDNGPLIATATGPVAEGFSGDDWRHEWRSVAGRRNRKPSLGPDGSSTPSDPSDLSVQKADNNALTPAATQEKGGYALHIRTFNGRDEAKKFSDNLKKQGFQTKVKTAWAAGGKGIVYHVQSGRFDSYGAARRGAETLGAQTQSTPRVILNDHGASNPYEKE